ncbi:unnamed protein product [Camellia sinensis]
MKRLAPVTAMHQRRRITTVMVGGTGGKAASLEERRDEDSVQWRSFVGEKQAGFCPRKESCREREQRSEGMGRGPAGGQGEAAARR